MNTNPQLIKKDFNLNEQWENQSAVSLDRFCQQIVKAQVAVRTGNYLGTGTAVANVVAVPDLPGPPLLVILEGQAGGSPSVNLVAYATGDITAWNQKGFTLKGSSAYNAMGTTYTYLVLA